MATAKTPAAPEEPFWLVTAYERLAKSLGSLRVAVTCGSLFAVVMALGTMVEQWYTAKLAQELVYKSWWFQLLLGVLFVNILFAALKKYPWKRHQIGFVITHLGLLLLIIGGLVQQLGGTDQLMSLVTEKSDRLERIGLVHETDKIFDVDRSVFRVHRDRWGKAGREYAFNPGSLAWRADEHLPTLGGPGGGVGALLAGLNFLANPLPRQWEQDLGDGAHLQVLNYYPHAREDPYSPAAAESNRGRPRFPAVRVRMRSKAVPFPLTGWVADTDAEEDGRVLDSPASRVEFLASGLSAFQVAEFVKPPADLGKFGVLALSAGGEPVRLPVGTEPGERVSIPGSDLAARVVGYRAAEEAAGPDAKPADPAVVVELFPGGDATPLKFTVRARGGCKVALEGDKDQKAGKRLRAWYHPADARFDAASARGVLNFVTDESGKLFYRSFSLGDTGLQFERGGPLESRADPYPVWDRMKWEMRFGRDDYLPEAVAVPRFVPEPHRPGLERPGLSAVVRCKLTVGGAEEELWLQRSDTGGMRRVVVGKGGDAESFRVGFLTQTQTLPFSLRLARAEQTNDPGTGSAATYSSNVLLTDTQSGLKAEERFITMNEPLHHRGYAFYQSQFSNVGQNADLKPINRSVFTVGYDPGFTIKMTGSVCLALGIFLMFYTQTYLLYVIKRIKALSGASA